LTKPEAPKGQNSARPRVRPAGFRRAAIATDPPQVLDLYSGLQTGAAADEVILRAEADGAPFANSEELRRWVAQGLEELS